MEQSTERRKQETWVSPDKARMALKIILGSYIALCFVIAGLNYGLASKATPDVAARINRLYQFYENELKTLFIITCSLLTWRIIGGEKVNRQRRNNLIGFTLSALAIHLVLPRVLGNREIYYTVMPLPWSTTGLQLMQPDSSFYVRHVPLWGLAGISAAIVVFVVMNLLVLIGTLLWGRRLQCSNLCLMNGFAAEIWAPVFPLTGTKKTPGKPALRVLTWARWIMLIISVFLTVWWLFAVSGHVSSAHMDMMSKIEVVKYLSLELLMAMFFWVVWTGRGYCHYCPLGTFLGLIAKAAGQRIRTDLTRCIGCQKCNRVCPMSVDVATAARSGQPVCNLNCVGCGHCVDACPPQTLRYETSFSAMLTKWRQQNRSFGHDDHHRESI